MCCKQWKKIAISQGYYGEVKDTNNVIFVFDDKGNKIMEFTSFEVYSNLMFAEEGIILSGENSKLYKLDFNCKIAEIPISSTSFVKDNNLLIPFYYNFATEEIYLFKFLKDKPQELIIIKKDGALVNKVNLETFGFKFEPVYRTEKISFDIEKSILSLVTPTGIFTILIK